MISLVNVFSVYMYKYTPFATIDRGTSYGLKGQKDRITIRFERQFCRFYQSTANTQKPHILGLHRIRPRTFYQE